MKTCTLVSPVTVAIFSGPAKLSPEFIKEAESGVHGRFSLEEVAILKRGGFESDMFFIIWGPDHSMIKKKKTKKKPI